MRGATRICSRSSWAKTISIHAPHARSDPVLAVDHLSRQMISIHAPHARSDVIAGIKMQGGHTFQSTLLMRGATLVLINGLFPSLFQSTLLMRGATDQIFDPLYYTAISIHAPHARSDFAPYKVIEGAFEFQSTLLMRGATERRQTTTHF